MIQLMRSLLKKLEIALEVRAIWQAVSAERGTAGMREIFVTVAGCRTLVQRGGEGPPLLWLHDAGGGGRWTPFLTRLAERYDVIAPELPGFGRSDTPDWFDNIHDVSFFVLDLLKAFDLRGVHLVGASLGGWVAAEAAVRSTDRPGRAAYEGRATAGHLPLDRGRSDAGAVPQSGAG
jgi:pimeloyl-ACP methyl ester carboxylesterase